MAALFLRVAGASAAALLVANCSAPQVTQRFDPKYGVPASPRVVQPGQPVPKGGGRELIGNPYVVGGKVYRPRENPNYVAVGLASWYGDAFHGRMTANGEVFDKASIAAAHPTLPLPSYVRVTNLRNHRSMIVRVNDRGPFHSNRLIDLSARAADALGFKTAGTAEVKVEYMGRASLRGSDDRKLLATLRMDGPATLPNMSGPVMVASAEPERMKPQPLAFRPQSERDVKMEPAVALAVAPRQQLASLEPSARPAFQAPGARLVRGVPLPPERPFDLGTIPNAGLPAAVAVPPVRPAEMRTGALGSATVVASLYQPHAVGTAARFHTSQASIPVKPQRFVSLGSSFSE